MEYSINKKVQKVFFIVAAVLILALLAGAFIRTGVYNQTERSLSLQGEVPIRENALLRLGKLK